MTIPPVLTSSTGGMAGSEGDCAAGSGGAALGADDLDRAVVVAVIAVRVVKMALHEVINVVAVRDRLVAAIRAVLMLAVVDFADAAAGVGVVDRDRVLLDGAVAPHMVQMAIVQVIDVAAMHDGGVAATGAVLVGMVGVKVRVGHGGSFRSPDADA
jgi:hypothetical protein